MPTKLDQLLADIDPRNSIQETYNRADEALNTFACPALITDWEEFIRIMANFIQHIEIRILRLSKPIYASSEFYWSRCANILCSIYGASGYKAAFEMARTGNEGGLFAVLRAVAQKAAEDYSDNEIKARVNAYWRSLTLDEKLAAPQEYLEKYGHLLPSELAEKGGTRVKGFLVRFLEKHPYLIQKMRGIGR